MGSMRYFEHHFNVNASLDRVAAFHKDPRTLKILTPPPVFVTFNELKQNEEDTIVDFRLWFGPFFVHWVAVISEHVSVPGFIDRQVEGPFEFWEHTHTFRSIDLQSTQVIDQIKARPGKQLIPRLISWSMWLTLPLLFNYRTWSTRRKLEKGT